MRKNILFLVAILCYTSSLFAQIPFIQSDLKLIYKISADEALLLTTSTKENTNFKLEKVLHTYIDTFSTERYERKLPSKGYFLFVRAENETLKYKIVQNHSVTIRVLNNDRDLALIVLDSLGNRISDATVYLKNKEIKYDETTNTYRKRSRARKGIIRIEANGQTVLYDLERDRRYFGGGDFWYDFGRWIRYRYPVSIFVYWYHQIREIVEFRYYDEEWLWNHKIKYIPNRGYVSISQPKYKPGDTVRVKAYITNENGRPLKRKVEVRLYKKLYRDESADNIVFKDIIERNKEGSYAYEFVLGDSLRLDKNYTFTFGKRSKDRLKEYRKIEFRYEDYEFDKVKYNFTNLKRDYKANEPIILKASGKDQNGNFVADGNIRLTVTTQNIEAFYDSTVYVPDTIWQHEQELNVGAVTQIEIPRERIPAATLKMEVKAEFYNSNGEYQKFNHRLTVDNHPYFIKTDLEGDSIIAKFYKNGKEQVKEGTLRTNLSKTDTLFIQFPYKAKVNPYVTQYTFGAKNIKATLDVDDNPSQVMMRGQRTLDSVFIAIENPLKLPVVYTIEKEKQLVKKGELTDDYLLWKRQDKSKATYSVHYQYVWAGKPEHKFDWIRHYPYLLDITLEQPKVVSPNETTQIKIKATDYKGKPAKKVNLTAGAINSTFGTEDEHIEVPGVSTRAAKKRLKNRKFEIKKHSFWKSNTYYNKIDEWDAAINSKWYSRLALEEELFYQLRFPQNGYFEQYDTLTTDTFYQHIAQFAPYIVKNGKEVPAVLIYCNEQLVYCSGTSDFQPYSFIGVEGWNRIAIRTLEDEYRIDSVYLKKGHKLEFSIDVNHYIRSAKAKHISKIDRSTFFTEQEKELLRNNLMTLRYTKQGKIHFVSQGNKNIHAFEGTGGNVVLGFFNTKDSIRYKVEDGFENTFAFEKGYEYVIFKNRERLYYSNKYGKNRNVRIILNRMDNLHLPKALVYTPSIWDEPIKITTPPFYSRLSGFISFINTIKSIEPEQVNARGTYQFEFIVPDKVVLATVLFKDDRLYDMGNYQKRSYNELENGKYTFYLFASDSTYLKKDILIRNDTLLFERFSDYLMLPDSNFLKLKKIQQNFYFEEQQKQNKKEEAQEATSQIDIDEDLQRTIKEYLGSDVIYGKVLDAETGEPLIGATISIVNTEIGTISDIEGDFILNLPNGKYNIRIAYIGYATKDLLLGEKNNYVIMLEQGAQLEEVVVIGYGSVKKSHLTGAVSVVDALRGQAAGVVVSASRREEKVMNVPGVQIRGAAAVGNSQPLIVVDGVVVESSDIDESKIANIEVLKDASATAIYGSRAANGVIIITTKEGKKKAATENSPLLSPKLRTDFRDYAYWQPNLMTDKNGEAYFTVTFPDNITKWRAYAVGMDKKRRAGIGYAETKAFQSVMAQVAIPRFLIEGDKTEIIGKSMNYTLDTFAIKTTFKQNGKTLKTNQIDLAKSFVEKVMIRAGEPTDSLNLSYELTSTKFADGEKRTIPIFRKGIEETVGDFHILKRDTTINLSFEQQYGDVTLYVQNSILEVLLEDIEDLKKYPYYCNEQTASKLIALVMERKIKQSLGEPFGGERTIRKLTKRLKKNQNTNGSWGWWQGGNANIWITAHAVRALYLADPALKTTYGEPLREGIRYIMNNIDDLKGRQLIQALALAAELDIKVDTDELLPVLDTTKLSLYDEFQVMKIKQAYNQEIEMDTLTKYQKQTTLGGKYWGDAAYVWFDNHTELTLLAYDIYKKAGNNAACEAIIQYFLEKRNQKHYRSTYKSAKILYTILPDLLKGETAIDNQLVLKGAINQTVSQFPFKAEMSSMNDLTIEKTGTTPLFISTSQTFHNEKPKEKADIFEVETVFKQKEKVVKNGKLEKNFPTQLQVTVNVKKSADYVMVEVPIPAGCSYEAKPNYSNYKIVHREYFKDKVAIFCQSLSVGSHTFTVDLEPRFTGNYTLNPAKVEQMYFPIFYGRNEMKIVEVK